MQTLNFGKVETKVQETTEGEEGEGADQKVTSRDVITARTIDGLTVNFRASF